MTERAGDAVPIGGMLEGSDLAKEQRSLLDLIGKIQYAQVSSIQLPLIAVVGDQSSGKSSVLEAITGEPFPRAAGACTRFATELRLRHAEKKSFRVEIIPDAENRSDQELERMANFGKTLEDSTPFPTLMSLATELIAPKNVPGRFAARDILAVEMQGPSMPHLTLVDLPGLVQNPNSDQSIEDIKAIEALTDKYMASSRTIILAVVGGNHDYVHAPILKKARHFDPSGSRTIGVLTKPDLTSSIGLEDKFIQLVGNEDKENRFKLGWFVLRNPPPPKDGRTWPSPEERKRTEDHFFASSAWSILPSSRRGVDALSQTLSLQLQRHIGRYIKTLRKELQRALDDTENELHSLGHAKETVEEMKGDLFGFFEDSNRLVPPAMQGTYANPPGTSFFPHEYDPRFIPAQNLRARVVRANQEFANRIRTQGSKHPFSSGIQENSSSSSPGGMTKRDFAKKEVEPFLMQHKGVEFFGDHNARLIYQFFQRFATNWSTLAREHKDDVGVICNEFLGEIIDSVWPQRMRDPIRAHFLDPHIKSMLKNAQAELSLILKDLQFEVQPYDPEYALRVRRWQARAAANNYTEAEEFLEKMLIFYELSAQTFLTNLITQVIERHLLQGLSSIFSSGRVHRMKNDTIELIAAEKKETRDRRAALRGQKIRIEEALDACLSLGNRKELRMYGDDDADTTGQVDEDFVPSPTPQSSSPVGVSRPPPRAPSTELYTGTSSPTPTGPSNPPPLEQQRPGQPPEQPQNPPVLRRPIPAIPMTTVDVPSNNAPSIPQAVPDAVSQPLANELDAAPQTKDIQRLSRNQQQQQQQQQQGPSPQPSPRMMPRQPDNFAQGYQQQQQQLGQIPNGYGNSFDNMFNNSQKLTSPPGEAPPGYPVQMQRPIEVDGQERQPARYGAVNGALSPAPPGYGTPARRAVSRDVSRERPAGVPAGARFVGLPQ